MKKPYPWLLCFILAGCVSNPINDRTYAKYYAAGAQAEGRDDLRSAQMNFSRALANAQMGNLGPAKEAYAYYEYARVTGYLGESAKAEQFFDSALKRIDDSAGKADDLLAPALCEYARLLHDTGQHQKAVPMFSRAVARLERVDIIKEDPIGFADFLDNYAESLRAASPGPEADAIAQKAQRLRERNKDVGPQLKVRHYPASAQPT